MTNSTTRQVLRWCGLLGAVLLAVASVTVRSRTTAIPLWFAGTLLLVGAWLVLGRRLAGVPLRWLLVTGALWALPLLASFPLESRDAYAYACQGSLVVGGIDPYTHGPDAQPCPWLDHVHWAWRRTTSPYGPLWLVLTGLGAATHSLVAAIGVYRLVALGGVALLAWAGHRLAQALGTDPVRGAWLALLSPLMLVHGLSGAHSDVLMAGLLVAALAVALGGEPTRRRALGVGALVGLAVAVKATALVAPPFVVLLLVRDRRWWSVARAGLVTGFAAVATYGVLWAATGYGLGWRAALRVGSARIIEWTSIPTGLGMSAGRVLRVLGRHDLAPHAVSAFRAAGLLVMAVSLVVLWLWARHRLAPRDVVLAAGIGLAVSVLLSPVAFPWYALTALAVLGYGLVNDRARYWVGVAVAPTTLLILPSGNGLAGLYKEPGGIIDPALVLVALFFGVRYLRNYLRSRRRQPVEDRRQPAEQR